MVLKTARVAAKKFVNLFIEKERFVLQNSLRMKAKEWFSLAVRGTALGTGILPGVSAGTVGIVVDVYDDLLDGIDGLTKKKTFFNSLKKLIPIGIGCLIATVLLMFLWDRFAKVYFPFVIVAALAGFVIGALPVITDELKDRRIDRRDLFRIILGFLFAAAIGVTAFVLCDLYDRGVIGWLPSFDQEVYDPFHHPWIYALVAVVGFLSAASCLVPGISGAMLLFIFGLYNPILGIFFNQYDKYGNLVVQSILSDPSRIGSGITIILALLVGMLIGFLVISHLLKSLLVTKRHETFSVVLGFILGSVVSMFINQEMFEVYHDPTVNQWWQFLIGGIAFVAVMIGTYFLIKRVGRRDKAKAEAPIKFEE